ncbi:hypothetical protein [Catalinimonas niigatensis]|uniref:hypothetical protein n=1 Tax=Catalinimonas niigatensis TaxID=1397264 RepID=UPI002665015C|nr:hypothetical protein [Catalinimonas niigatensis]WPP53593.1 hypothetical protein PZB72_14565 [Catalinimonas niigatensis]
MKKYLIGGILSLTLLMPWGCNTDDCGDLGGPQYFDITNVVITNVRLIEDGYSIEESLAANSSIPYQRFGLHLMPAADYISMENHQPGSGLFPAAYACSPMPPQPTEEIADIAIFSNTDFIQANSTRVVAAGDTLNSLFNIYDRYSGRIVGLPDFLVDDHLKASDEGFILQPAVMPAAEQAHEFTVHYRLTNNEFYSVTTMPVSLTP